MNVPHISKPLPFSAGNQQTFGGEYIVGVVCNPNMSPSNPVVLGVTDISAGPPSYSTKIDLNNLKFTFFNSPANQHC